MTETKNVKCVYIFMTLAVICSIFTSCSSKKPDYLLMFGRDNGFVAAYRVYIKIDGEQVNQINEWRYDNYIHGKEKYDFVRYDTHSFNAVAKSTNPNELEYVKNKYDKDEYDVELVKNMLTQMGVDFTGDVYIIIYSFDDISVISAEKHVSSTIDGSKYGVFRNGKKLDIPDNVDMCDLRDVCRLA